MKVAKFTKEEIEKGDEIIRNYLADFKELINQENLMDVENQGDDAKPILVSLNKKYKDTVENTLFLKELVNTL